MDKERYEVEKKMYKHFRLSGPEEKFFNYRLITEKEVPKWVKEAVIFYI
jgi:hypothetical protein